MLKGLLLCVAMCAAPTTVFAGDRDLPLVPDLKAFLVADGAAGMAPGRRVLPTRPVAPTFLPIAYRVERSEVAALPADKAMHVQPVKLQGNFTIEHLRALPDWHLTALTDVNLTSVRGGSWAVYDTLADHRKPRFRRSAFSTMLVLRIDGEEDSPPISVGGGGVAAALWRAMPGN
jgi:hypothetical protein